jgi:tetratricopeptide (TPR) repeat protein
LVEAQEWRRRLYLEALRLFGEAQVLAQHDFHQKCLNYPCFRMFWYLKRSACQLRGYLQILRLYLEALRLYLEALRLYLEALRLYPSMAACYWRL